MIAKERLYLTAEDNVVSAGHPDARWLLAAEGTVIPKDVAARYGLTESSKPAPAAKKPAAKKSSAKKGKGK